MGKDSGGGGSKDVGANFPGWVQGAHKRLVGEAEKLGYGSPYPDYGAERIVGFSPEEINAFSARRQMYDQGDPWAGYANQQMGQASNQMGNFQDVAGQYQARDFDFGRFPGEAQQQYMDPYQQEVTDIGLQRAREEFERQENRSDAERVASGARGGYREALEQTLGRAEQGRALGELQAQGSLAGYQNAQGQFERDRQAAIQAAQMGDSSQLAYAQQRMQADLANQESLRNQIAMRQGLASTGMDIGTVGQQREKDRITEMERAGMSQREMGQARADLAYEDFQRQEEWPWQQISRMGGVMSGVPQGLTATTRSPGPSTISQLMGLGMGAAGLQSLFGK